MWCLRVNGLKREWWLDLPELTSIRLGGGAFSFKNNEPSELIMRSGDDEMKWIVDMPKLTSLTTVDYSSAFRNPRIITLEGISSHAILTSRYAQSHHCHSCQGACFQGEDNRSYEEFLFFPSLIPRHHFCSSILPRVFSFPLHTNLPRIQITHLSILS